MLMRVPCEFLITFTLGWVRSCSRAAGEIKVGSRKGIYEIAIRFQSDVGEIRRNTCYIHHQQPKQLLASTLLVQLYTIAGFK